MDCKKYMKVSLVSCFIQTFQNCFINVGMIGLRDSVNLDIRENNSEALVHAKQGTMGKKVWLSMHPRNFGSEKIVHTSVHTSSPSCKPR